MGGGNSLGKRERKGRKKESGQAVAFEQVGNNAGSNSSRGGEGER